MGSPLTKDLNAVRGAQQVLSIGPNLAMRDVFYILKMADNLSLWRALLELQFHLCKLTELPFLYQGDTFKKAKRVLEIGYGDGELFGGLAPYFPEKKFTQAFFPTRHVLGDKRKTSECLKEIDVQVRTSGTAAFDFVVLRVVVQKVSQLGLFINGLTKYLAAHGTLLVIDAFDPLMKWRPSIPTLDHLMKSLGKEQEKTGAGRTAAEKVYRRASLFGLRPVRSEKLPVSGLGAGEVGRRDFYTYFLLLSEVMVRAFGPVLDQPALLADLDAWIADDKAHAQIGLHFVELERC